MTSFREWQVSESDKFRRVTSYREWQVSESDKFRRVTSFREWQVTESDKFQRVASFRVTSFREWQVTECDKLQRVTSFREWQVTESDKFLVTCFIQTSCMIVVYKKIICTWPAQYHWLWYYICHNGQFVITKLQVGQTVDSSCLHLIPSLCGIGYLKRFENRRVMRRQYVFRRPILWAALGDLIWCWYRRFEIVPISNI